MAEPPADFPPPAEQDAASVDAGFQAGPPVADLCGFKIPFFIFKLTINLPPFPPPFPPDFLFSLSFGLNCSLDNPIDISAGVKFGGGRTAQFAPDPDLEEAA